MKECVFTWGGLGVVLGQFREVSRRHSSCLKRAKPRNENGKLGGLTDTAKDRTLNRYKFLEDARSYGMGKP